MEKELVYGFGKKIRTSDDCVSRQAVVEYIKSSGAELGHDCENEIVVEDILNMPPVTPIHGTCKDCKYCEDIGVKTTLYCKRYGINHLDKYYCADFEKRGNENGSN